LQNIKKFSKNERERKTDNFNLFDDDYYNEEDSENNLSHQSINKYSKEAIKSMRDSSDIVNNSIRGSKNKAKKLRDIEKEKSLYGIKDLDEIISISRSNLEGKHFFFVN